jgi:hypothetical protein
VALLFLHALARLLNRLNLTLQTAGFVVELIGPFASTQYFRIKLVVFVSLCLQLSLVILLRFI